MTPITLAASPAPIPAAALPTPGAGAGMVFAAHLAAGSGRDVTQEAKAEPRALAEDPEAVEAAGPPAGPVPVPPDASRQGGEARGESESGPVWAAGFPAGVRGTETGRGASASGGDGAVAGDARALTFMRPARGSTGGGLQRAGGLVRDQPPHPTRPGAEEGREQADYGGAAPAYLDVFPREAVMVVDFDRLVASPDETMGSVLDFIGVSRVEAMPRGVLAVDEAAPFAAMTDGRDAATGSDGRGTRLALPGWAAVAPEADAGHGSEGDTPAQVLPAAAVIPGKAASDGPKKTAGAREMTLPSRQAGAEGLARLEPRMSDPAPVRYPPAAAAQDGQGSLPAGRQMGEVPATAAAASEGPAAPDHEAAAREGPAVSAASARVATRDAAAAREVAPPPAGSARGVSAVPTAPARAAVPVGPASREAALPPAASARVVPSGPPARGVPAGPRSGGAEPLPEAAAELPAGAPLDAPAWIDAAPQASLSRTAPDSHAASASRQVAQAVVEYRGAEAQVVLDPEELGPVRLIVTLQDGGTLIQIVAERPETAEMMRRHADLLLQDLAASGVGQARLSFASGGEAGAGRGERAQLHAPEGTPGAAPRDAPGNAAPDRAARTTRGLDMRV